MRYFVGLTFIVVPLCDQCCIAVFGMPIVPDVLDENLKMIICGSALGNVSAAQKAYYAHT